MLLGLVQGGELFSLMHQAAYDGMSEKDARFYSAGVLEGLSHIHRKNIIYRDLKAENVLIDKDGYPVIVDFGFGKKTFVFFCGISRNLQAWFVAHIELILLPYSQICSRKNLHIVWNPTILGT